MRWACRSARSGDELHIYPYISDHMRAKVLSTAHPSVLVLFRSPKGDGILRPYYAVHSTCSESSNDIIMNISECNATRLYARHKEYLKELNATKEYSSVVERKMDLCSQDSTGLTVGNSAFSESAFNEYTGEVMPGQSDVGFLSAMKNLVQRRLESGLTYSWSLSPDLYSLWSSTSRISTELFSDAMSESGVLKKFCSSSSEDVLFCSRGPWRLVESYVEGAGGSPPFDVSLIRSLLMSFDAGVRREVPYCRCAVLPLGKQYLVQEYLNKLSSEGILLLTIAEGGLSFHC